MASFVMCMLYDSNLEATDDGVRRLLCSGIEANQVKVQIKKRSAMHIVRLEVKCTSYARPTHFLFTRH